MGQRMLPAFVVVLITSLAVKAVDSQLTTDFFVPPGVNESSLDGSYFTFTGLRSVTPSAGHFATVTGANLAGGFTALTGLGVSNALLTFPPGTLNPLHTHPRGTETLYVIDGTLDVGLLDSTNKLYTQTLVKGDIFVFPVGLVHFQINWGKNNESALALASFSSSNAGLIVLAQNEFGSSPSINQEVLSLAFGVSIDVIATLQAAE